MDKLTNQIFIYFGLLGSILLGALFIENASYYVGMLVIMLIIGITSMIIRTMYAFALLISFILGIAFYNVGISWVLQWDVYQQGMNIRIQSILSFGALMAWLCGYAIQQNRRELLSLKNELSLLKKYDENTGVLTFREFTEQAEILFTGMKRRKEDGYLLYIAINENQGYKRRIIKDKLSKVILSSVRIKFDLVGELHERALILFLNKTNDKGMETVLQRIKKKCSNEGISEEVYEYESKRIGEHWQEELEWINSLKKDEAI